MDTDKNQMNSVDEAEFLKTNGENPMRSSIKEEYRIVSIDDDDLKVMKCDIAALLKVIEEIENRLKMEKILNRKQSKDKDQEQQVENEEDVKAKLIRQQFSMLNFNRNYLAIKYAQENPTNNMNKLSL